MAGEKVLSGNLRLKLNGKTIFDAIDCSLTLSRETKQRAATKDTAAGVTTKGARSWSASYNGLAIHASDGVGTHDFEALFDLYIDDTSTLVTVQFSPDSEDSAAFTLDGEGIITELGGTFNAREDATISLTVTGSGDLEKTAV